MRIVLAIALAAAAALSPVAVSADRDFMEEMLAISGSLDAEDPSTVDAAVERLWAMDVPIECEGVWTSFLLSNLGVQYMLENPSLNATILGRYLTEQANDIAPLVAECMAG
jgi:hypothetical protein